MNKYTVRKSGIDNNFIEVNSNPLIGLRSFANEGLAKEIASALQFAYKENDFLAIEQRDGVDSMGVTRWISVHPNLINEPLTQALVNVLLQSHIKIADLEDEIREIRG